MFSGLDFFVLSSVMIWSGYWLHMIPVAVVVPSVLRLAILFLLVNMQIGMSRLLICKDDCESSKKFSLCIYLHDMRGCC